jgi:hypothetical protein
MSVSEEEEKRAEVWKVLTEKTNRRFKPTPLVNSEDGIPDTLVEKLVGRDHLEDQNVDERIILKCILKWADHSGRAV